MPVELLFPQQGPVSLTDLQAKLVAGSVTQPFEASVVDACVNLSQRILRDPGARRYPELLALAFWMRKAELHRLHQQFDLLQREDRLLVPCGTVFHLPPRNVDTMFVYSWLLSALTGNFNVIRLSPQRSGSTDELLRFFCETLEHAGPPAREGTWIVSYGHEEEPTEALSALCDMRVIWGGDHTVSTIRRIPIPPHARETVFADRFSLAAIEAASYLDLNESRRAVLAKKFFDDAFWFDQMACSSPRLVVWCGTQAKTLAASADFFPRVNDYAMSHTKVEPGQSMHRFLSSCLAVLDRPVTDYRRFPALSVLTLASLSDLSRDHPGGSFFLECQVERLAEIVPALRRRDQTLTWFGFSPEELKTMAVTLNGRALDRIVPIGQALQFGRFWDGNDLLQSFCRQVFIGGPEALLPS
ncbi:MAG: acyl-CoA reductase [Candidatus Sulfotelmatobacter sp.]